MIKKKTLVISIAAIFIFLTINTISMASSSTLNKSNASTQKTSAPISITSLKPSDGKIYESSDSPFQRLDILNKAGSNQYKLQAGSKILTNFDNIMIFEMSPEDGTTQTISNIYTSGIGYKPLYYSNNLSYSDSVTYNLNNKYKTLDGYIYCNDVKALPGIGIGVLFYKNTISDSNLIKSYGCIHGKCKNPYYIFVHTQNVNKLIIRFVFISDDPTKISCLSKTKGGLYNVKLEK